MKQISCRTCLPSEQERERSNPPVPHPEDGEQGKGPHPLTDGEDSDDESDVEMEDFGDYEQSQEEGQGRLVGEGPQFPISARAKMLAAKGKEKVEKEKQARKDDTHQINAGIMRSLLGAGGNHPPSQTSSTAVTAGATTTIPDSGEQDMENVGGSVHQGPDVDVLDVSHGDPNKECSHCHEAKHTCKMCSKIRCRQYHLNTFDDGDSFICSLCDPEVVGILGQTLCRVPGVSFHGEVERPASSQDMFENSDEEKEMQELQIRLNMLREPVIQLTPRKQTDQQAKRIRLEVNIYKGTVANLFFVGPTDKKVWAKEELTDLFMISPGHQCFQYRIAKESLTIPLEVLMNSMNTYLNNIIKEPTITFRGTIIDPKTTAKEVGHRSLTIVIDGADIPVQISQHQGKLFQCQCCGFAATMKDHYRKKKKCKQQFLFKDSIPLTWGRPLDKNINPYGLPDGHRGAGSQGATLAAPAQEESVAQPAEANVATPSVVQLFSPRVKAGSRLEQIRQADQAGRSVRSAPSSPTRTPNQVGFNTSLVITLLYYYFMQVPLSPSLPSSPSRVPLPPRRGRKVDYKEPASDREDISGSESADEWEAGKEDEPSDDEDGQDKQIRTKPKRNIWKERFSQYPNTDNESDDDQEIREKRREVKISLHEAIEEAMKKGAVIDPLAWVPDQEDEKLLKEVIIGPIMRKSSAYCNFGPRDQQRVRDSIKAGNMFKGGEGKQLNEYAKTAQRYVRGLERWLGLYQMELRKTNPNRLVGGDLKLRQFYAFRQPHFLELPLNIQVQLDLIHSNSNKQSSHIGYRELVHSVAVFLGQEKGKVLFEKKTRKEEEMDEVDWRAHARSQHAFEITHTSNILELLGKNKPFKTYRGAIMSDANLKADYRQVFEGDHVPDPAESVPKYIGSKESRDLYTELINLAENKVVVSKKKMPQLSRKFVKRLIVKGCYRVHIFNRFRRYHYLKALNDGPCRYMYKTVTQPAEGEEVHQDEEGIEFNVLTNPHISQAELENLDEKSELFNLSGIACKIEKHKTGGRYPCWMWFSPWDQTYLKAYEEVAVNYMEHNKIPYDNESAFFIDSKVNACLWTFFAIHLCTLFSRGIQLLALPLWT